MVVVTASDILLRKENVILRFIVQSMVGGVSGVFIQNVALHVALVCRQDFENVTHRCPSMVVATVKGQIRIRYHVIPGNPVQSMVSGHSGHLGKFVQFIVVKG